MIINSKETRAVSSYGWVDKSAILIIDIFSQKSTAVKVGDAEWISIKKIPDDKFVVIQHFSGEQVIIGVYTFDDPKMPSTNVTITSKNTEFVGDSSIWRDVPKYYVEYLKDGFNDDFKLIKIDAEKQKVDISLLGWYDDTYDKGYQGVIDVVELPDTGNLLFSIQRDSQPVLYDPFNEKVIKKIELASRRMGNPVFTFRNHNKEIWCIDYDTVLKIGLNDWKILAAARLQNPLKGMSMTFVGDFSFTPNEKYCAIARPYSKDVVLLDCSDLKIVSQYKCKDEPLSLVILSDFKFIYRDWKSGKVGFGLFKM